VTRREEPTVKHTILGLAALALLTAAVAFSRQEKQSAVAVKQEKRNPWTSLQLNSDPGDFRFAIVSDRTGSHRAKVFSRAVERLNLLQPAFVLSVGDLIEGGRKPQEKLEAEWLEFDGYVKRLQMPFFYVPGNHDVGNAATDKMWRQRYGRRHYHFVYRDVLFLCLNTDDPPGSGPGNLGAEQVAYAKKALAKNAGVRWTIVALHKPIWTAGDLEKRGWAAVEKALADRPYTVFCGHIHRYRKYVRQERNYYQLATTGGGSRMRGVSYGEFDHVVLATMKKTGPVLANILLDSVLPDDLRVPDSGEAGVKRTVQKTFPVRGQVYLDGVPVVGATVIFVPTTIGGKKRPVRGDAVTEGDGSFVASTYGADDGLAAGEYAITITQRRPLYLAEGKPGPNLLPAKYASAKTSGLAATIKAGDNEIKIELSAAR
jgi:3',5'-cyclic AMP phosphodiesterase CpdA